MFENYIFVLLLVSIGLLGVVLGKLLGEIRKNSEHTRVNGNIASILQERNEKISAMQKEIEIAGQCNIRLQSNIDDINKKVNAFVKENFPAVGDPVDQNIDFNVGSDGIMKAKSFQLRDWKDDMNCGISPKWLRNE